MPAEEKKLYRVREGFAVHVNEKTVHLGGDVAELDEHTANRHFHKLEELDAKAAAEYRKANQETGA